MPRPIDADRLLSDAMKSKYYHLPNGDVAIPIIDIEHAPTIGGWISVKDMPPEANTNDEVLTTYVYDDQPGKYYVETATYWDDGEGTVQWDSVWDEYRVVGNARKTVIAWMPMPKPYKPLKEENDEHND